MWWHSSHTQNLSLPALTLRPQPLSTTFSPSSSPPFSSTTLLSDAFLFFKNNAYSPFPASTQRRRYASHRPRFFTTCFYLHCRQVWAPPPLREESASQKSSNFTSQIWRWRVSPRAFLCADEFTILLDNASYAPDVPADSIAVRPRNGLGWHDATWMLVRKRRKGCREGEGEEGGWDINRQGQGCLFLDEGSEIAKLVL